MYVFLIGANQGRDQKHKMNHTTITSDRYIAIKSAYGLTFNKTLRILTKGGEIIPARWSSVTRRLESCAINSPAQAVPMYEISESTIKKLNAAKIDFDLLTLEDAKALTT